MDPARPASRRSSAAFLALLGENLIALSLVGVLLGQLFGGRTVEVWRDFVPPIGFAAVLGLLSSAWAGRRLQRGRDSSEPRVTALPLAPTRTVLVLFLTGILGPVYLSVRDPASSTQAALLLTWEVGMASTFVYGLLELVSALTWAPWVAGRLPRSASLATLASLAVVAVAVGPSSIIFEQPYISLPVLAVLLLTSISRLPQPLGIPPAWIGLGIGAMVGLASGQTSLDTTDYGPVGFPIPQLTPLLTGLSWLWAHPAYLMILGCIAAQGVAVNVAHIESAAAMGDLYSRRKMLLIPAFCNLVGGLCGSSLPCQFTLGYQAYKSWGSTSAYAQGSGLALAAILSTGALRPILHLVPEAAWAPLFMLVLLAVVSQNLKQIPSQESICIAVAMIPHIAGLLATRVQSSLSPALLDVTAAGAKRMILQPQEMAVGQQWVAGGATVTSLLWAGIAVAIVRSWPGYASAGLAAGCLLSALGFIHATSLTFHFGALSAGYLALALVFRVAQVLEPPPVEIIPKSLSSELLEDMDDSSLGGTLPSRLPPEEAGGAAGGGSAAT